MINEKITSPKMLKAALNKKHLALEEKTAEDATKPKKPNIKGKQDLSVPTPALPALETTIATAASCPCSS